VEKSVRRISSYPENSVLVVDEENSERKEKRDKDKKV
jgi:hypothetical protein